MKRFIVLASIMFLAVCSNAASVKLAWDPPTNCVDGTPLIDLSGYKLYYGYNSRVYSVTTDVGNVTTAEVSSVSGVVYFAVTAYLKDTNTESESDFSEELLVCFEYPANPVLGTLSYNFKTGKMTITWTKPTKNVSGTPITSPAAYILSYGKAPRTYTYTTNIAVSLSSTTLTIPQNSGIWYFSICTSNTYGNVGPSSSEFANGSSKPSKVTNVSGVVQP